MRVRRVWPAALALALSPLIAGCGDDSEDGSGGETSPSASEESSDATPSETSSTASEEPTPSSSATSAVPDALPDVCDLVSAADVSDAYSETFEDDGVNTGTTTQQGVEWKSKGCDYESDDRAEVEISLAGPDDFTKGKFQCLPLSDTTGIVSPADVTGATKAWWKTNEAPPLEATLRACTDKVVVQVEIEYEDGVDYEGDPQGGSTQLAEQVLDNL